MRLPKLKKRLLLPLIALPVLLVALFVRVQLDINGDWEGLYLLKGDNAGTFILTDDLFFGEQHKLLLNTTINLRGLFSLPHSYATTALNEPTVFGASKPSSLAWQWRDETGRGYVINTFANGTRLLTCFGRYRDGAGAAPAGLLVGGSMPNAKDRNGRVNNNASGMAFNDGQHWYHIWCSVNEAIVENVNTPIVIPPSRWRFLDSRVVKGNSGELVLRSRHEILLNWTTLTMERFAIFRGGDRYFTLVNRVTNTGTAPADYSYVYGDEPWMGKYGSSAGDVGWLADRYVHREGRVDLGKYGYAGMVDYGNDLLTEGHAFTGVANFIQWLGEEKPESVFFSNKSGSYDGKESPLSGDSRFIGLEFGPHIIRPGRSNTYVMAIGMADKDFQTGHPVKPAVNFSQKAIDALF